MEDFRVVLERLPYNAGYEVIIDFMVNGDHPISIGILNWGGRFILTKYHVQTNAIFLYLKRKDFYDHIHEINGQLDIFEEAEDQIKRQIVEYMRAFE